MGLNFLPSISRFTLVVIALALSSYSQAPNAFNYQAILRNSDGKVKTNETVSLQISIVNDLGVSFYIKIHNPKTSELGLPGAKGD